MSSKSGFMTSLSKSTKITFFSCVGFVALTCLILVFFILFPITPSEKIMASIGRENVLNGGSGGSPQSITPGVVTTSAEDKVEEEATTKPVSTTTRTVNIKITTGSGFLWNGRIPTGVMVGGDYPTTPVDDDPIIPTPDPGHTGGTTQNPQPPVDDPPIDTPQPPVDNPDNPPVDNPDNPPVDTPDPPPVDTPDPPPVDNPDPNGGGGDNGGGGGGESVEPSPNPAE